MQEGGLGRVVDLQTINDLNPSAFEGIGFIMITILFNNNNDNNNNNSDNNKNMMHNAAAFPEIALIGRARRCSCAPLFPLFHENAEKPPWSQEFRMGTSM